MAPGRTEDPFVQGSESALVEPKAPHEPGVAENKAKISRQFFPRPPKFEDKYEEREYLKGRLAAAFRIFGKYGFDEV